MMQALVLDDEASSQEVARCVLQRLGIERVECASNGARGILALRRMQTPPDLILCDIFMPEMDGIEFVNALVDLGFAGSLVFISGMDPQYIQVANTIAGGSGLRYLGAVLKPLRDEELREVLARHTA